MDIDFFTQTVLVALSHSGRILSVWSIQGLI